MEKELAEFIVKACEDASVEVELRESYGGRGMYGSVTCGVVVDDVTDIIRALLDYIANNDNDEDHDWDNSESIWRGFSYDSMGRGTIVY